MSVRLRALVERVRSSLFFVPMLFVVAGGLAGLGAIELDQRIDDDASRLPFVLTSTVDSARVVLSVIASATITVAGIAFSVVLLVIQQASSQFSPRLVHSLFRDPFNRRVMGIAVGTFTYCLVVLRAVRGPLEETGEPVIPSLSVAMGVALGIGAMLAIVAFIDHNAHTMEVSAILARVADDTVAHIERSWSDSAAHSSDSGAPPPGRGHQICVDRSGWVQQISSTDLLDMLPDGGTLRLETTPGRYVIRNTPMATMWPDPDDAAAIAQHAHRAIQIGTGRTTQQDPSYGIRQLADVALIALSPGVNDPTTAQDAIVHLAAVLHEALARAAPPQLERDDRGRRLLRPFDHTHASLVELAFDEIRRAGAGMPTVCTYLFDSLHVLHQALLDAGLDERAAPLQRQAELTLAGAERSDMLPDDLCQVVAAFQRRFGSDVSQ